MTLPVLYSFRRCPYAIRARMAIALAGIQVELREVALRHKPAAMLGISPKGTVPVLQLPDHRVLDESLDIMHWALTHDHTRPSLLTTDDPAGLIAENDGAFKYYLDRYKYADRYPEQTQQYYRQRAEVFLTRLEKQLSRTRYLHGETESFSDIALFPFIRQFAMVDLGWFENSGYTALNHWLMHYLNAPLFQQVMHKYAVWRDADATDASLPPAPVLR